MKVKKIKASEKLIAKLERGKIRLIRGEINNAKITKGIKSN
jgi:hypothetical protein